MYRNVFGLIVEIDGYEPGAYLQTKHATYQEIQTWVKQRYNLHVSNHAISQVKGLCGLARDNPGGTAGYDGLKLRPDSRNQPQASHQNSEKLFKKACSAKVIPWFFPQIYLASSPLKGDDEGKVLG